MQYSGLGMRRGPPLASLLTVTLAWCSAAASPPAADPATADPATAEVDEQASALEARKAAAKREVQGARAAFSAEDYQAAVEGYRAALAILPAPKLHFNIGVCHQRLAMQAKTAQERTRQHDLAIDSYNRYLADNPRAEDRLEVAETIRELGGIPVTMPALKPLFEEAEQTAETKTEDEPDDEPNGEPDEAPAEALVSPAPAESAPPRKPPYPHHGRFAVMLAGGLSPGIRALASIDAPALLALDLHAGGFLGRQRRFLLAAQTMLYGGTGRRGVSTFGFSGYSVGLLGQQTWVLGREGVQLSFGGVAALTGQGLDEAETGTRPVCSASQGGQVASRTGALLAPRFDLGVLIGARRRGIIAILVQPSFAAFGDGRTGDLCADDETPWTSLGVRQRWQVQLWAGAGLGFRF